LVFPGSSMRLSSRASANPAARQAMDRSIGVHVVDRLGRGYSISLVSWTTGAQDHIFPIGCHFVNQRNLPIPRRVWRMTADSPLGEVVDFDPTVRPPTSAAGVVPHKVLTPPPLVDWRGSSFDLLSGVDVRDHTDSIPGELFDRLFRR